MSNQGSFTVGILFRLFGGELITHLNFFITVSNSNILSMILTEMQYKAKMAMLQMLLQLLYGNSFTL